VSTEKDIKESQRKITEVESGIQGVGNLFDNLKTGFFNNFSTLL
jgi:hypothetical protein